MSTISVMKYIPQTPEGYTYDDDGNLAQDARWEYTWDGENRLVAMQTKAGLTPKLAKRRLEFTYDYMGRRALKKVYEVRDEQTFTSTPISTTKFLYDDWNLIAELDKNNTVKRSYTWGTDISGSMQGAGGVGGLLWMEDHGASKTYFYLYDGNGNVTSLVDADTGEQVADYDYGPFGEPVKNVSTIEQPFRFSTKYRDEETKLYYYGYRYYSADVGRFINRDPIEEKGGYNIYGFVNNEPISLIDTDGRGIYGGDTPEQEAEREDIIYSIGLFDAWLISDTPGIATGAVSGYPGPYGGVADAMRHTIWLCEMARSIGYDQAMEVGDIHEKHHPPPALRVPPIGYKTVAEWQKADTAMDLHNNKVGAKIGDRLGMSCGADCVSEVKTAYKSGKLKINQKNGYKFP